MACRKSIVAYSTAVLALVVSVNPCFAESKYASAETSQDFIKALKPGADTPLPDAVRSNVRSKSGTRGLALSQGGASDTPPPVLSAAPQVSFQVEFELNSASLTPKASGVLDELGRALTSPDLASYRFQLTGHTDATGSASYNRELSKRRAAAVRDYLSGKFRIDPARLRSAGMGADRLLDPENPQSGVNRRVEITNLGS